MAQQSRHSIRHIKGQDQADLHKAGHIRHRPHFRAETLCLALCLDANKSHAGPYSLNQNQAHPGMGLGKKIQGQAHQGIGRRVVLFLNKWSMGGIAFG